MIKTGLPWGPSPPPFEAQQAGSGLMRRPEEGREGEKAPAAMRLLPTCCNCKKENLFIWSGWGGWVVCRYEKVEL